MKRFFPLLALVSLVMLASCQSGKPKEAARYAASTASPAASVSPGTPQVIISRGFDFGSVNPKVYGVFNAKTDIDAFADAVQSAKRMKGILDVRNPDYDAVIDNGGKRQSIHLWLDAKDTFGMFMYTSDTGTGYTLTEAATKRLRELVQSIRYGPEQAEKNGDVVFALNGIKNGNVWTDFLQQVQNRSSQAVQITAYTIEGDPIFYNLDFDGAVIRYRYDTSHDHFGTPLKQTDFCRRIEKDVSKQGTVYYLDGCGENNAKRNETFALKWR